MIIRREEGEGDKSRREKKRGVAERQKVREGRRISRAQPFDATL